MKAEQIRKFMNSMACRPDDQATYEVALQLAEINEKLDSGEGDALVLIGEQLVILNEKLTPARLVAAIEEIQARIDAKDGGPR